MAGWFAGAVLLSRAVPATSFRTPRGCAEQELHPSFEVPPPANRSTMEQ